MRPRVEGCTDRGAEYIGENNDPLSWARSIPVPSSVGYRRMRTELCPSKGALLVV